MTVINEAVEQHAVSRKRGAALEDAILEAAYAELSEVGYTAFTVEGVAARARTGKASIYRRWQTKQDLVGDVLSTCLPAPQACGLVLDLDDSVTTRQALRDIARAIAKIMASPAGDAMRAIKLEALADPQLARLVDDRFQAPRREQLLKLLRRGVERGEVREDAVTPLVADVLPSVLTYRIVVQRHRLTERDITAIMEQVMIPLVEAR